MRALVLLALLALLAAAPSPASAHGGPTTLRLSDQGCVITGPPCIFADNGASVPTGSSTIYVVNELEETHQFMVHLDDGGQPGAVIAGVVPVDPGTTTPVSFVVPEDATGVWFMTLKDGAESARLLGDVAADGHGDDHGEESPGPGVVALLGVLAVAAVALRRS